MNESVLDLVRKFYSNGKPIAAICHGLMILAAADCIKGRNVTGYKTMRHIAVAAGAHWVEPVTREACVADGNLITAALYAGHPQYIQHLVKALNGFVFVNQPNHKRILFLCGVSSIFPLSPYIG